MPAFLMESIMELWAMLKQQKGMATLLAVGLIVAAFGVGLFFKHATDHLDHPIEQAAENILEDAGIDIDFSEDKKQAKK